MMLENALKEVEKLARTTAFGRFAAVPLPYIFAQYIQKIWFPITHRGVEAEAPTFFGHPLRMMLPSATDIYLTGGKTHDSEIRLAQFLLKALQATSHKPQATNNEQEATSQKQQAASHELEATSQKPQAASREQEASSQKPQAANHEQEATSQKPQVASHELEATSQKPQAASHELEATSQKQQAASHELEANNLKLDAKNFIDIGAHIGYFTALAAQLVGEKGQVVAVEAAKGTFQILSKNVENLANVTAIHAAATAKNGELLTFYEFPVLYSEYNTMHVEQFENDRFFKKFKPEKVEVKGVTVDSLVKKFKLQNPVIKIDAEGAEAEVIAGTAKTLREQSPTIIMEYLRDRNESHKAAFALLVAANFTPFSIENGGILRGVPSPADYFKQTGLDSDNFVFLKNDVKNFEFQIPNFSA